MKKLVVTLGIFLSAVLCVQAQQAQNVPAEKQTAHLTGKISDACHLTTDQTSKIKPFVQQFVEARNEDKDKYQNDKNAMRSAMKTNRTQLENNLKTVLSADQMTELHNYWKEQRKERKAPTPAGQQ